MNGLQSLPPWLILLFVMTMTALITEVLSNMATLNLLVPILISLVISQSIFGRNLFPLTDFVISLNVSSQRRLIFIRYI